MNARTPIWMLSAAAITVSPRRAARRRQPKRVACAGWSSWPLSDFELPAMRDQRFSLRFYRWLLKLYPAAFREEYAGQLERQFRDELTEARGPAALATLWAGLVFDLAISVPAQLTREIL